MKTNCAYAVLSSGSIIHPIIKLACTLRYLAGGSWCDKCFGYDVSKASFYKFVWEIIGAINESKDPFLNNINFSTDEDSLRELEGTFTRISGQGVFPGTVAAGDGVVFEMMAPTSEECDRNVTAYFTRKGYYAFGMQGFVDGLCRFVSISTKVCSSCHDSTAYVMSNMCVLIERGNLPFNQIVIVMISHEPAYTHGPVNLWGTVTPYVCLSYKRL